MDPALLREREAFKRKAMATPSVEVRDKKRKTEAEPDRFASKGQNREPAAAPSSSKSDFSYKSYQAPSQNYFSILAKIVKHMKQQHLAGDSEPRTLEEILDETNQLDIGQRQRNWLESEALRNNPKIEIADDGRYGFKPTFKIKDRKGLLRLLDRYDRDGKGGINIEDILDSMPNAEKAIKQLGDSIIIITRPVDKKKILYYNDKSVQINIDEEFQKQWRSAAVDGLDEQKIDEYLASHGITTMTEVGRKINTVQKRKKTGARKGKLFKKTNLHVAGDLKDYSDMA